MALITACMGAVTWYGVHSGGIGWAQSAARGSLALIAYLQEGWDLRGKSISYDTTDEIRQKLAHNEIVLITSKADIVQIIVNPDAQYWFTKFDINSISKVAANGYYKMGQVYSYIVRRPYEGGESNLTYYLVRYLDKKEFLSALKKVANAEIVLLQQKVLESTFISQTGESPLPIFTHDDLESIWQTPRGGVLNQVMKVKITDYAGFDIPTESEKVITHHKGDNELTVYSSFFPVVNADGSTSGYIGILIPEGALLAGAKKGLYVSFLMMLALTTLSAFMFAKFSRRLTNPLTITTQRLVKLTKVLSQNFQIDELEEHDDKKATSTIREIAKLQEATHRLEKIFYKSEEMRIVIDTERAKSFTASKMAALGEISAGIAHEINTPLAAISMLSSQIQSLIDEDNFDMFTIKQLAERTEATTFKIAKIIKGLQSYARDANQDPLSASPLKSIISDSLALCSDVFKKSSIKVFHDEQAIDTLVNCRPTQISQVLLNLINNARDAIEEQECPWINISVEEGPENIKIRVTDSGDGIPESVREKLFLPFFTTKPIGKGTGLGLSISEKIVKSHGGQLELDPSSPNTCFVITLPKYTPATRSTAA